MCSGPRLDGSGSRLLRWGVVWICLLGCVLPGGSEEPRREDVKKDDVKKDDEKKAPARAKKASGQEWLGLELGLVQVRKKYLPALVLFDAPALSANAPGGAEAPRPQDPDQPSIFEPYLLDSGVKDALKRFVLIRVSPDDLKRPYPIPRPEEDAGKKAKDKTKGKKGAAKSQAPDDGQAPGAPAGDGAGQTPEDLSSSVAGRLGLGGERSAVVVLSYWESAELTYVGELPTRTKLKDDLNRFWKVNKVYADEARRVEPKVEQSKYAAKLGNLREAVTKVRDLEDPKAQLHLDPVLKKKLTELLQEYRAKAQKSIEDADRLEAAKKYTQAIEAYDKVMVNYPFQDLLQQVNKKKGDCLRKLTLGV